MKVAEAVELYRYGILHLSHSTQQWYERRLKQFAAWCDAQGLTLERIKTTDVRRYIEHLRTRQSETADKKLISHTVHGHARAVRAFLNWCSQEDGINTMVAKNVAVRIGMPHMEEKVIETFSDEQIKALMAACEREYIPKLRWRDKAIVSILLDTGIRVDELCGLTLDNVTIQPESGFIKVLGKGNKWREVGLGNMSRSTLHKYLSLYRKAAKEEQHVFLSRYDKPLTVSGLGSILGRLGEWAHIKGVSYSPHVFRHTFATRYLLQGGDVLILSLLMGHTSVNVTQRYLKSIKASQARRQGKSVLDNL